MLTGMDEVNEAESPLKKRKGWKKILMVIE